MSSLSSVPPRSRFSLNSGAVVPAFAIVAVLMLVVPVPPAVLDLFLLTNIGLSVTVLILSLSVKKPLDFSAFPTLLLFVTLMRLSLEVTATRLILTQGNAGGVIQTFGSLVVGGNIIIGLVIFAILVIIQFLVITNGTERVSQVAARFTLDAMPGRQSAIDAELMAGRISEAEAHERRKEVHGLADFYGAMDGATKFVRGDAIAGILIVAVNLLGGLVVGLAQQHLGFGAAAQTYSVLSVGEGLTTQIPALLISTATGFLMTQAAGAEDAPAPRLWAQLVQRPSVFYIVAGVLVLLVFFGMPPFVPLLLAGGAAFAGWRLKAVHQTAAAHQAQQARQEEASRARSPQMLMRRLQVEPLSLTVGVGLGGVIGGAVGRQLQDRMQQLRERMLDERGFLLPALFVHDDSRLEAWEYRLAIRGETIARGTARPDRLLAIGGALEGIDDAVPTTDPVFGAPAAWILPTSRWRAELTGATVSDTPTILITHTADIARKYAWRMLSREVVKQMVEQVRAQHPTVVQELIPDTLSLGEIQQVLQHLLREQVSIRDLPTILEALSDRARRRKDIAGLVEAARHALGGQIVEPFVRDGHLAAIVLDQQTVEAQLHELLTGVDPDAIPPVDPETTQRLWTGIRAALQQANYPKQRPVLLCGTAIRFSLARLLERVFPALPVLAFTECMSTVASVDTLAVVHWPP